MTQAKQLRGGSWLSDPRYCRSASRSCIISDNRDSDNGFRVVCNEPSPPSLKILRGGSWGLDPRDCRSAARNHLAPGDAILYYGFRVVCNEEP